MNIEVTGYLNSAQAAKFLGYAERTLIQSRTRKVLGGRPSPKYTKRGVRVFYLKTDLIEWAEQFDSIDLSTH